MGDMQEVIRMTINDYLEDYLIRMLAFREAAGYAIVTYRVSLMPFIKFCCSEYQNDFYVPTKQIIHHSLKSRCALICT